MTHLPRAQALPSLFFSRLGLSIQGSNIWPVISTESLHLGECSLPSSPSVTRDQNPAISGLLANLCSSLGQVIQNTEEVLAHIQFLL